jgi:hypothetical protein
MTNLFLDSKMTESRRFERTDGDITVSAFTLTLLLIVTVAAAYSDRPVFWHLIGTIPLAAAFATTAFLQPRPGRRGLRKTRATHVLLHQDQQLVESK